MRVPPPAMLLAVGVPGCKTSTRRDRAERGAWHEWHATDRTHAAEFYMAKLEWGQSRGVDMGAMGIDQLFSVEGRSLGGIMTEARQISAARQAEGQPLWQPW